MPLSLLPSQLVLLSSLTLYPLLHRLFTGPRPTPLRYTTSLKSLSTIHSLLTTSLALLALHHQAWAPQSLAPHGFPTSETHRGAKNSYPDDTHNPLIINRSEFLNAITALETGYLIQDTCFLLFQPHARNAKRKSELDKTLLTHHVLIGTALLILQHYIARSRESGVYIIVRFLLMNASTPFLNLRWYLRRFTPQRTKTVFIADIAFAIAFFYARIWLVGSILAEYGTWHGWSAWEAYWWGLRVPCQVGTGALWLANVGWLGVMVRSLLGRREFTLGGQ